MKLRYIAVLAMSAILLSSCGKKEEPVETVPPTPAISAESSVSIKKYGDAVTYDAPAESGIKEATSDYFIIYPDKTSFSEVKVSILQGGVNAYYSDAIKKGMEVASTFDGGFSTVDKSFGFIYTSNWNTVMFEGVNEEDIKHTMKVVRSSSSISEYENYEVNR